MMSFAVFGILLVALIFTIGFITVTESDVAGEGEAGGECSETGNHTASDWIRVFAAPADPMPMDSYEVIASVEVFENGSWSKEWNGTMGELVRKPDSPSPQVIDRQNGTIEGIRLHTQEPEMYRVWAGICRNNMSYWNFINVTIHERNDLPVPIALIGKDNGTTWSTDLEVWIDPGDEVRVFFNGNLSYDPDGDELDLYWDVDGKSPIDDLTGPWGNWTFSTAGYYPIVLTAGDGNETVWTTVRLTIHYAIFPDLVITTAPYLLLEEFYPGEMINVTTRIQNRGENESGSFSLYVYDHDLTNGKNTTIYKEIVANLGVNEFFTLAFNWTTTGHALPGTHIFRVVVDAEHDVSEGNESNNQMWGSSFSILSTDLPFVTITDMSVSNETPFLFHMVNVTLTVSNSGTGPAEMITVILLVNGEDYAFRYIPEIAPGEDVTVILPYSASLKGSYNLTCRVYDNGFLQGSEGRRIIIKDIAGPTIIDKNETDPSEELENLDWLMMGAGVFMIIMAVALQILGKKAREK